MWVVGGVLAVLFPGKERGGLFLLALVLLFAGLSYLGTARRLVAAGTDGAPRPATSWPASAVRFGAISAPGTRKRPPPAARVPDDPAATLPDDPPDAFPAGG